MGVPDRIAGYAVEREIGRGGMGVVYLGRDSRLGRLVALKVLPEGLAADPDRLARLEREARVLASLNHPNIAAIYGLEDAGGSRCLVLEYVEGPTLAERLAGGAMAVDEAVSVCAAIAAGVEAAHEAGVVHRDLKPGNVKVTAEGKVKVLDFGLAKGVVAGRTGMDVRSSPTVTVAGPATGAGIVMGTAGYMSPEQARGKAVDRRTDIWALGCVLYECLTGGMVFGGETASDAIAAILEREPDWSLLPARTPVRVRELLFKCLEKDATRRLRDIGDARLELERAAVGREWTTSAIAAATGGRGRAGSWALAAVIVAAAGLGAGGMWFADARRGAAADAIAARPEVTRLTLTFPDGAQYFDDDELLSPDGRVIAYIARGPRDGDGRPRVYLRRLDSFGATFVEGSEGAFNLVFSPDGRWLAWRVLVGDATDRIAMRKASVDGGPPVTIAEYTGDGAGGIDWADDGHILMLMDHRTVVARMPEGGGAIETLFTLDSVRDGADWIGGLRGMPGGKAALVTAAGGTETVWHFKAAVVKFGEQRLRVVLDHAGGARFVRPGGGAGCLVFSRGDGLFAAAFDPERLEVTGAVTPILSGLSRAPGDDSRSWIFSDSGTLVYTPSSGSAGQRRLAFFRWGGAPTGGSDYRGPLTKYSPRISPDGKWVAATIVDDESFDQLAVFGMDGTGPRILHMAGADAVAPVWTTDGRRLIFEARATGKKNRMMWRAADGSDAPEVLLEAEEKEDLGPTMASPDGTTLLVDSGVGNGDILALDLAGERKARPWLATPASESGGMYSPDGKWVAYLSNLTGRPEVYVRPAAGGGTAVQVSTEGGVLPAWTSKGDSITFGTPDGGFFMAQVSPDPLRVSAPTRIDLSWFPENAFAAPPDGTPDGPKLVAVMRGADEGVVKQQAVVLNWFSELEDRLARK